MPQPLPAVSLVAVPGRRRATLEIAKEMERRGFAGIYSPSPFGNMALCQAIAQVTERIPFGTSIAPIYARTVEDFAQSAAFIHEISGGRFRFGVGVSHGPSHIRMGVKPGKPLSDTRAFVEKFRAHENLGGLPPITLATLRVKMIALSGEIAQGLVFANGSRSHMQASLAALPAAKRSDPGFFIGNMVPTCVADDIEQAKAVNRKTLTSYALLPNYRAYWKEAGYVEEMTAIEQAVAAGRRDDVPKYLTDKWLADCALFGPAKRIRDELERWYASGITTPIVVPSSAVGNQIRAIEELFATFTG
jgi:alkanesulfonate monooxygenase SsuD/methylene tetrahydromethanopterin reductase-like flavin-dependent oxidoreductase (luciferase family)